MVPGMRELNMTKYVAGLLFDSIGSTVALIHKTRGPAPVIGKWNAIGGKVKVGEPGLPDESSAAAMWREFIEEAGVDVPWTLFLHLMGDDWQVDFYHAFDARKLAQIRQMEEEQVGIFCLDDLPTTIIPNLRWILPMATGHKDDHVWVYRVDEFETFGYRQRVEDGMEP